MAREIRAPEQVAGHRGRALVALLRRKGGELR